MGEFLEVFPSYRNDKVGRNADGALNLHEKDPRTKAAATQRSYGASPVMVSLGSPVPVVLKARNVRLSASPGVKMASTGRYFSVQ